VPQPGQRWPRRSRQAAGNRPRCPSMTVLRRWASRGLTAEEPGLRYGSSGSVRDRAATEGVGSTGLGPKGQARQQDSDATDSKEITGTPKMSSQPSLPFHFASEEVMGRTASISRRPASSSPGAYLLLQISARTMERSALSAATQ